MIKIIGCMLLGICTGFLFRKKEINWVPKVITVLIWILLFILGIEVGSNDTIIDNLHTLGLQALVISLFGTLGSCTLAWVLWRHVEHKKEDGHER